MAVGFGGTALLREDATGDWTAVSCPTEEDIYGMDYRGAWACGSNGVILHCNVPENGWELRSPVTGYHMYDIASYTTSVVAVGSGGAVFKSTDQGTSWQQKTSGTSEILRGLANYSTRYLAVGYNGTIIRSSDDGETWSTISSGTTDDLFAVLRPIGSGSICFACGRNGTILRSSDDGRTWELQQSGTLELLRGIGSSQFNSDSCWMVTVGGMGTTLNSVDSGFTWMPMESGVTNLLNGVSVTDSLALAVGADGTILSCDSGVVVGMQEDSAISQRTPLVFSLAQVTPSPFRRRAAFRYSLPKECDVALRVYNSAGRVVAALVQAKQRPGWYTVKWDLSDIPTDKLPCGTYFCRLEAGVFTATRKMVKSE
jgi:photosystem II stability/assembly factor-like uncharacterized protein